LEREWRPHLDALGKGISAQAFPVNASAGVLKTGAPKTPKADAIPGIRLQRSQPLASTRDFDARTIPKARQEPSKGLYVKLALHLKSQAGEGPRGDMGNTLP